MNLFELSLVDICNGVSSILEQVNEIHYFFLSELEVLNVIVHAGAGLVKLFVLLDEFTHIIQQLLSVVNVVHTILVLFELLVCRDCHRLRFINSWR